MSNIRVQSSTQTWSADHPRTFVVGREASCDIVSDNPAVSRRHAEIRAVGDGWEVADLGSSHGTFVAGQPITRTMLSGTTIVSLGRPGGGFDLTVTVTAAAAPLAPMAPMTPGTPGTGDSPATVMGVAPAWAAPPAPDPAAHPAPPAFQQAPPPPTSHPPTPYSPTAYPPASHPAAQPTPPSDLDMTVIHRGGSPGAFGPGGPGLLVRLRSGDLQFPGGQVVRLGRDPQNEVVTENASASRLHAVVEPRPDGWWLVDRSTSGTFIDGERITAHRLTDPVEVCLGHPTAGFELELVPIIDAGAASAGIASRKRRTMLARVGAVVGALVLVGGGVTAAVVLGGDDDPAPAPAARQADEGGAGLSETELNRAKAATVYLVAYGPDGSPVSGGSGSIISEDGLILTNAHVADSGAPGQGGAEVGFVEVYFTSPEDDKPVELRYRAEPIVSDGYLDITVAQITADGEGNPVAADSLDLPEPLPLGDSDDLRTLDEITALGYPDLSRANSDARGGLPTLTVTKGTVSTFNASDVIGVSRAEIDADLRIGSGNSGGPSIDENGEIIGLNTRVFTENIENQLEEQGGGEGGIFTGGSARIVPVNLAEAVLDLAEQGGDREYVSPYLEALPDPEEQMTSASIAAHGWSREGDPGTCTGASTVESPQIISVVVGETLQAEFTFTGLADGTLLDLVLFSFEPGAEPVELLRSPITWSADDDGDCVFISYQVPEGIGGINAVPQVGDQYVVDNPVAFQ